MGNGYYTINQRKFAYLTFQFGFLVLWVTLIILGTFLRGPNWNFFGPYEIWDTHKVEALNNVDLSQYVWDRMIGVGRPKAPDGASALQQLGYILLRESPGILLTLGYFAVLPPLMALTVFRPLRPSTLSFTVGPPSETGTSFNNSCTVTTSLCLLRPGV